MQRTVPIAVLLASMLTVSAQDTAVDAFAMQPDEVSPFFASGLMEEAATAENSLRASPMRGYPRPRETPGPAVQQVKDFFTGMFAGVEWPGRNEAGSREVASLALDPSSPVLSEEREVEAVYTIRNLSNEMTRLEFPTTQRIEILTKNPSGAVVGRWSDDRAFQPLEGIVVINPKERIEYREPISTREMRPGEAYTVEATMATDPSFPVESNVVPR